MTYDCVSVDCTVSVGKNVLAGKSCLRRWVAYMVFAETTLNQKGGGITCTSEHITVGALNLRHQNNYFSR